MFTPHYFQQEAIDAIYDYFCKGKRGNPLIVAPTGSGKSVIIGCFCQQTLEHWQDQKILVISHVKEILRQNHSAIERQFLCKEIGLYSAGLGRKTIEQITVAGIHSIYNKPEILNQFNVVLVDECHTIPVKKGGMYRTFFENVRAPIIGFTATPFRLGTGYLHIGDDAFFNEIVYTIPIKKLQDEGFLCRLSTKLTEKKLDAGKIRKQAGDYVLSELSKAFDRKRVTREIVQNLTLYKDERKKWLVFAIDIKHCDNVSKELNKQGISAKSVHSKTGNRDETIKEFKQEDGFQALVSVAMLTTGFDCPAIDLIAILRATDSPALNCQMIGRGLRTSPCKENCLVLDFAGNSFRNGPIDSPVIKVKGQGAGEPVMKGCPECFEIVPAATRICPECNHKFLFRHRLNSNPKEAKLVSGPTWHKITDIKYIVYVGLKGIPMIKVIYHCNRRRFNEYICIEHKGYARTKAIQWWEKRSSEPTPLKALIAVDKSDSLKMPVKILVDESGKYTKIKKYEFQC